MVKLIDKILDVIETLINELDNISRKNKIIIGYLLMILIALPIIFLLFKIVLIIF